MNRQQLLAALQRKLQSDTSGAELTVELGEVYFAYPALNTYAVLPRSGDRTGSLVIASAAYEGSSRRSGVNCGASYVPGTPVLYCRTSSPVNLEVGPYRAVYPGFLLGAAPGIPLSSPDGYAPQPLHSDLLDYFTERLSDAWNELLPVADAMVDMSYGTPTDVFGGDFSKVGSLQNFLSLGSIRASIGSSPFARIDCFSFYDKVRITAATMEEEGPMHAGGHYPDKDSLAYYTRHAFSNSEGLGAYAASPMQAGDDGRLELAADDQLGIFRHRVLGGRIADGEWETISDPEVDAGNISTSGTVAGNAQIGRLSIRKHFDGTYQLRAARQIDLIRSLYIPVPAVIKAQDKAAFALPDAESTSSRSQLETELFGFYDAFAGALEHDTFAADSEAFYNRRLRGRGDYWKLYSEEDLSAKLGIDLTTVPVTLDSLTPTRSQYDEPTSVTLTDPVTEEEQKFYAVESCIRQMPDGAVIITDGHGSEIRMYRGKIAISAAADIEIRPGRDLIEMTPRNRIMNASREIMIHSGEESVRIKAEKDLKMLAGNSGSGVMVLESRATGDDPEPEDARSLQKGIVIKSASALGVVAEHMYIGVRSTETAPGPGRARNGAGTILIDAAGGALGLLGARGWIDFPTGLTMVSDGSLLSLQGGTVGVAGNMRLAGGLRMSRAAVGTVSVPEFNSSGLSDKSLGLSTAKPLLEVNGQIKADGAIQSSSSIRGLSILGSTGAFGNAADDSGLKSSVPAPNVEIPEIDVSSYIRGADGMTAADPEVTGIYDESVKYAAFRYPDKKGYQTDSWVLLAMRWQLMLQAGGAGETWSETAVQDADGNDTYIYPGDYWADKSKPLLMGVNGASALTEYITNAR